MYFLTNRGLGAVSVDSIAQAIAQMEGYNTPGTLAARNNNPGNLRSGPGQTGNSGGFAVFPDASTGWAALDNQITLNAGRGLTLNQFFAGGNGYPGYAPSADANNPAQYAAFVASQTGADVNTPLNSLLAGSGSPVVPDSSAPAPTPADSSPVYDSSGMPVDTSGTGLSTGALVGLVAAAVGLVWWAAG